MPEVREMAHIKNLALPGETPIAATLAAAYMVYLAYRIATAPPFVKKTKNKIDHRSPAAYCWPLLIQKGGPR